MKETLKEEKQDLSDAISQHSSRLNRHVRQLASALRDKTEATPFAADTLILANQVNFLCDYVEHLHNSVDTLLAKIEAEESSAASPTQSQPTAVDKKAIEIQREIHEFHPTLKDTIKALFMWRDSPEQRLRDGK